VLLEIDLTGALQGAPAVCACERVIGYLLYESLAVYACSRKRDSSSWSSPPLMLLLDIHSNLITQYDYQEVCAPSQSQVNTGTGDRNSSQDGVSRLPPSHSRTSDCVILSSSE
jgi:hypothetical protein